MARWFLMNEYQTGKYRSLWTYANKNAAMSAMNRHGKDPKLTLEVWSEEKYSCWILSIPRFGEGNYG